MRITASLPLLGLIVAATTGSASAQALRGRLLEWPGDRPIAGGTVSLGADTLDIEFRLRVMPFALDALEADVRGEGAANPRLADTGFFQRRRIGLGEFLTREDIVERPPTQRITDLLVGMRGVQVTRDGIAFRAPGESIMGGCAPRVYLDGMLSGLALTFDFSGVNSIPTDAIEAIEVYRGPSEIPPQYGGAQGTCGVVLLWTRRNDLNDAHERFIPLGLLSWGRAGRDGRATASPFLARSSPGSYVAMASPMGGYS
jgi:hypothetical protein